MRRIVNPFLSRTGYNCFGCCPDNTSGLKMEFFEEGEDIICEWKPLSHLQGYDGVLHGGIQTALLDEIASWCVNVKLKTAGVTSRVDLRYRKPVFIDQEKIILKGRVVDQKKNLVFIKTELYDAHSILCTDGVIEYYTFSQEIAKTKFHFPGIESFYGNSNK